MLVVVGMLAVSMSFAAGLATVTVLGVIALLAAATEFASAVWSRRWQGVLVHLLVGALYAVFGFLILSKPGMALATLTLLVAAMFLVGGIFRVVVAVAMRFPNWGWEVAGGAGLGGAGDDDLAGLAGVGRMGDRPAGRDRPDLHRLVVGGAGAGPAPPAGREPAPAV